MFYRGFKIIAVRYMHHGRTCRRFEAFHEQLLPVYANTLSAIQFRINEAIRIWKATEQQTANK